MAAIQAKTTATILRPAVSQSLSLVTAAIMMIITKAIRSIYFPLFQNKNMAMIAPRQAPPKT